MADRELDLILKLKDEVSKDLSKINSSFGDFEKSATKSISKISGALAGIGSASFAAIAGEIGFAVKAYADSEKQMASFNATMKATVGQTLAVNTGMTETIKTLKLTGAEAEGVTIAIKEKNLMLKELADRYKDGKLTAEEYALAQEKVKNQISQLNNKLAEADVSQRNITRTISLTKDQVNAASKAFMEASKAAVKMGFDDEDSALSMAKLFQITGSQNDALKLNVTAMDLARSKTIDLSTATTLVGQVLAGNGKVLKQYGIDIKDSATPLEALAELQRQVGGQAIAFANTLEGKLLILRVQFENIQEAIGKPFADALSNLISRIQPLVDSFSDWVELNPNLTQQILVAGLAVSALVAGVGFLGLALPAVVAGFNALFGPLGLVLLAIGGVAFIVSKLNIDWPALLENLKNIDWVGALQNAWNLILVAVNAVSDGFVYLLDILNQAYDYFQANILPVLMALWNIMVTFVGPALNDLWTTIVTKLWPALVSLWTTIATKLWPSLKDLWNAIQPLVIVIGAALYGALVIVVAILVKLIDFIARTLTALTDLVNFIVKVASAEIKTFANALNLIVDAFKAIVEWGAKAAQYMGGKIGGAISSVTSFISGRASGGPVSSGTPYMVGERGPELFIPSGSGNIMPNGSLGGGITVIVNGDVSGKDLIEKVKDAIMREVSVNYRFAL